MMTRVTLNGLTTYYLLYFVGVMSFQVEYTRKACGFTFLFGRLLDPQVSSLPGEIAGGRRNIDRWISRTDRSYLQDTPK
jgi:hypothetical protein